MYPPKFVRITLNIDNRSLYIEPMCLSLNI